MIYEGVGDISGPDDKVPGNHIEHPEDDLTLGEDPEHIPEQTRPLEVFDNLPERCAEPEQLEAHVENGTLPQVAEGFLQDEAFLMNGEPRQEGDEVRNLIPTRYFRDTEDNLAMREQAAGIQAALFNGEPLASVAERLNQETLAGDPHSLVALKMLGLRMQQECMPSGSAEDWATLPADQQHGVRYGQMMVALSSKYGIDALEQQGTITAEEAEQKRQELYNMYGTNPDFPKAIDDQLGFAPQVTPTPISEQYRDRRLGRLGKLKQAVGAKVGKAWEWFSKDAEQEDHYEGRELFQLTGETISWVWEKAGGKAWLEERQARKEAAEIEKVSATMEIVPEMSETLISDVQYAFFKLNP